MVQLNFIRYFVKHKLSKSASKVEPFSVKLSPNENIDRVLGSLFRLDSSPTIKNLDLSMRFFRALRSLDARA